MSSRMRDHENIWVDLKQTIHTNLNKLTKNENNDYPLLIGVNINKNGDKLKQNQFEQVEKKNFKQFIDGYIEDEETKKDEILQYNISR